MFWNLLGSCCDNFGVFFGHVKQNAELFPGFSLRTLVGPRYGHASYLADVQTEISQCCLT